MPNGVYTLYWRMTDVTVRTGDDRREEEDVETDMAEQQPRLEVPPKEKNTK